ncbi:MAG: hypothetical protein RLZZ374_204 [Cyanobacteriota bacterium]
MVNASLNWASIVGIVLAVGGALLYFMRSFKPALARDYDVFFAAVGLLCGGILFFQGWRLDPILQFGQFLLAGTTVFFAYESVRLRGITTEQARRSSFIDDEDGVPVGPRIGGRDAWGNDLDRLDEPEPLRRRIRSRQGMDDRTDEEDFYRPRTTPRTAIPERAVSRSGRGAAPDDWNSGPSPAGPRDLPARTSRYGPEGAGSDSFGNGPAPRAAYGGSGPGASAEAAPGFGARRRDRNEGRRGTRPSAISSADDMPRSGRRPEASPSGTPGGAPLGSRGAGPQGSPIGGASAYGFRPGAGPEPGLGNGSGPLGAAPRSNQPPLGRSGIDSDRGRDSGSGSGRSSGKAMSDAEFQPLRQVEGPANPSADGPGARGDGRPPAPGFDSPPGRSGNSAASTSLGRDNSSRFDD